MSLLRHPNPLAVAEVASVFCAVGGPRSSYTQHSKLDFAFVSQPKHVTCSTDGAECDLVVVDILCVQGSLCVQAVAAAVLPPSIAAAATPVVAPVAAPPVASASAPAVNGSASAAAAGKSALSPSALNSSPVQLIGTFTPS